MIEARSCSEWPSRGLSSETPDPSRLACLGIRGKGGAQHAIEHTEPHPVTTAASEIVESAGKFLQPWSQFEPNLPQWCKHRCHQRWLAMLHKEGVRGLPAGMHVPANDSGRLLEDCKLSEALYSNTSNAPGNEKQLMNSTGRSSSVHKLQCLPEAPDL